MVNFKVRIASAKEVFAMRGRLREADVEELEAVHGDGKSDVMLMQSYMKSKKSWVGMLDDKPVLVFGVGEASMLGTKGIPWLLGTKEVESCALAVARHSKEYITKMHEDYDMLENYVSVDNHLSLGWLRWCDFTIDDPIPFGVKQKKFHRVWRRRDV